MPQYVIVYLGGNQPSTPDEGKQHFARYKQWLSSLGDSAVSPANPLKDTSTVNPDGSVINGERVDNVWLHYYRGGFHVDGTIDCQGLPFS